MTGPAKPDRDDEDDASPAGQPASAQRIDKWLWFVRAVKSRTLAADLVSGGKVRLNRQRIDKPSHLVRPGDVITLTVRGHVRVLQVVAAGVRRGPATEARTLYEELTPPMEGTKSAGGDEAQGRSGGPAQAPGQQPHGQRPQGTGRPTKRDRRQIDRLKDE